MVLSAEILCVFSGLGSHSRVTTVEFVHRQATKAVGRFNGLAAGDIPASSGRIMLHRFCKKNEDGEFASDTTSGLLCRGLLTIRRGRHERNATTRRQPNWAVAV